MKNKTIIQRRMERYVRETLLEKLGWPQRRFSLKATELGVHNHVFFLDVEGAPPLVVKGIAKQQRFKTLVAAANHLLRNGIPVPRILCSHEDRGILPWLRLHVICEERIVGTTVFDADSPAALVPAIAGLFSRLHNITRDFWGKLSERNRGGLHEYLLAKARGQLNEWAAIDDSFPQRLPERCTGWMKERKGVVNTITTFSLSHCDPNPGNIMVREDGSMYLLDVGHLRYLPRAIDYYHLVVHFCRDSRELQQLFDEQYFAGMAAGEREKFSASQQFFKLHVLIDFGHNLARRRAATDPKHPWHQEFIANSKKVRLAMEEIVEN